jgi:adenosylcobinamide kinase / adenosylcobinamide-phosphate guanylyltransferase
MPSGDPVVITLVLGGARSGKSVVAERLVGDLSSPVTYIATLEVGDDADLAERVELHRARRPSQWVTLDAGPDLLAMLRTVVGSVLVDSLGPWVSGSPGMEVSGDALCSALVQRAGDTVVVSEEVGLSVHPSTEEGRRFCDALGTLNQAVATVADQILLVVAGCTLRLDPPPAR